MGAGRFAGLATLAGIMTTLFAAIAANGEKTLAVLVGVPKLFSAWSSALPLGTGSAFMAGLFGVGLWLFLLPRLPRAKDGGRPQLMVDTIVIVVVLVLVLIQQVLAGGRGQGQLLMAFMVGGVDGFIAAYLGRAVRSAWVHWKPGA
jgi:hypothetical protein